MKNNQFAIEPVDRTTELKELRATHFIDDSIDQLDDPIAVWQELLHKTVLEAKSQTVFKQKLNNYLATPEMTLGDFLDSQQALTNDIFYRVAMQLLEFDVDIDFKLDNPIEAMKQIKLPIVGEPIKTKSDLLHAWYL